MRVLSGPVGAMFGILLVATWGYAMFCAIQAARNSNATWRWFMTFWPAESLSQKGLRYRNRFYGAVAVGLALGVLAFLVLPA